MKKLILLALVLSLNLPAFAGVVQKLVEVDAEERERAELERIRDEEAYRAAAEAQKAPVAAAPTITQEELVEKAQKMREEELSKINEAFAQAPKPAPVVVKEEKAEAICASCLISKVLGSVVGVPVGAVVGMVRGAGSKGSELADNFNSDLGYGVAGNVVGAPAGAVVGGVAGGVTGLIKGAVDGAVEGWSEPRSKKSFSLEGNSFTDYDPYDLNL